MEKVNIASDDVPYSQLKENLSARYHLSCIVAILEANCETWLHNHKQLIIGLVVGFILGVVFMVPALDLPGNFQSQTPIYTSIPLNEAATDTEIIDTELTGDHTTGFNFSGRFIANNQPVNSFECSLDGGEYAGCSEFVKIDNLQRGEHVFEVRSILGNGTKDPTPAVSVWSIE